MSSDASRSREPDSAWGRLCRDLPFMETWRRPRSPRVHEKRLRPKGGSKPHSPRTSKGWYRRVVERIGWSEHAHQSESALERALNTLLLLTPLLVVSVCLGVVIALRWPAIGSKLRNPWGEGSGARGESGHHPVRLCTTCPIQGARGYSALCRFMHRGRDLLRARAG